LVWVDVLIVFSFIRGLGWSGGVGLLVSTFGGRMEDGSRGARWTGSAAFSFLDCDLARCPWSGGEREVGAIVTSIACGSGDVFMIIVMLDPFPLVALEWSADWASGLLDFFPFLAHSLVRVVCPLWDLAYAARELCVAIFLELGFIMVASELCRKLRGN